MHRPVDLWFPRVWTLLLVLAIGLAGCREQEPAEPAAEPVKTRKTLGKTTRKVLRLADAVAAGGVLVEVGSGESGGIAVLSGALTSATGQIGGIAAEQALRLHEAEHGQRPATHEEFMRMIIRPGESAGVDLPMLPYDREYAYDEQARRLVVVEFPKRR